MWNTYGFPILTFKIQINTLFKACPSTDFYCIVLWIAGTAGWAPLVSPVGKLNLESFNYFTLRPQIYFCKLVHACCLMLFVLTNIFILFHTFPYYSMLLQVVPCCFILFKISVADTSSSSSTNSSTSTLATSLPLVDKNTEIMAKRRTVRKNLRTYVSLWGSRSFWSKLNWWRGM